MSKLRLSFCVEICYAKSRKFCYAESSNAEIRSLVIMLSAVMGGVIILNNVMLGFMILSTIM